MPLLCAPLRAPVLRKRDHRGIFVVFRDFVIWAGELPKLPAGGDGLGNGCVGRGGSGSCLMTGPSGPVWDWAPLWFSLSDWYPIVLFPAVEALIPLDSSLSLVPFVAFVAFVVFVASCSAFTFTIIF